MKKLVVLAAFLLGLTVVSFGQSRNQTARKEMIRIEKEIVKEGQDSKAITLINKAKAAEKAVRFYLEQKGITRNSPGFSRAALENLKSTDDKYRALLMNSRQARKEASDYLSRIDSEYASLLMQSRN